MKHAVGMHPIYLDWYYSCIFEKLGTRPAYKDVARDQSKASEEPSVYDEHIFYV